MTARVSMLLKLLASLTRFRACFLPRRAKDLSAPRYCALKGSCAVNVTLQQGHDDIVTSSGCVVSNTTIVLLDIVFQVKRLHVSAGSDHHQVSVIRYI